MPEIGQNLSHYGIVKKIGKGGMRVQLQETETFGSGLKN